MAINVKIVKSEKVDSGAMLKRFTKKMQESGVIPKVKSKRFSLRKPAQLKKRKDKMVKIESAKRYESLKKMGKLQTKAKFVRQAEPATTTNAAK